MKKPEPTEINRGRTCLFCGHTYINPCDGENASCQNLVYLLAKAKETTPPTPKEKPRKPTKRKRVRL